MTKACAVSALLLAAATVRAGEPDIGVLVNRMAKVQGQTLVEIRAIKDKATAQEARKSLEALGREQNEIRRAIAEIKMSAVQREEFDRKLHFDLAPVADIVHNEVLRVSRIQGTVAVLDDLPVLKEAAIVLEGRAKAQARTVDRALKTFMLKNDGNPPSSLKDISRYLNDPMKGLLDLWDKEYQLGSAEKGDVTIYYIWTITPFGGGKKQISSRDETK